MSQIACIPLLIKYLGNTAYTLFAIAISLQGWWLLADFGIGNSVQNYVSEKKANGKGYTELVTASFIITACISAATITILFLIKKELSDFIFPDTGNTIDSAPNLIFISGTLYIITAFGQVASKIQYAEDIGYIPNILNSLGASIGLLGIWMLAHFKIAPSLVTASIIWIGPSGLLLSLNYIIISYWFKFTSLNLKKNIILLIARGYKFFIFGIFASATLLVDYIIAGKYLNNQRLIEYNISTKIFLPPLIMYAAALTALWPRCTHEIVKNNWGKVDLYLLKFLAFGMGSVSIYGFIVWIFKESIFKIMGGGDIKLSHTMFACLILYSFLRIWCDVYAMVIMSMSKTIVLIGYIPIQALISIFFQIHLSENYGAEGILLGLIISFLATCTWILPVYYYYAKKSVNENKNIVIT